jgi:uncharacterized protein
MIGMMTGNIANMMAIVLGALLGMIFKKLIKPSYSDTIMAGMGIVALIMGIMNVMETNNLLLAVVSIVLGSFAGEVIKIDEKINAFGSYIGSKFEAEGDNTFAKGFVSTSLIYCVGAMAILGSIESGLKGTHSVLYTKAVMDGVTAIIFTSTLGIGVAFSAASVFIYQGSIILLAGRLSSFFTEPLIVELTAVGGIMIVAIGLNVLELKKIKVANMLPALLGPILYFLFK